MGRAAVTAAMSWYNLFSRSLTSSSVNLGFSSSFAIFGFKVDSVVERLIRFMYHCDALYSAAALIPEEYAGDSFGPVGIFRTKSLAPAQAASLAVDNCVRVHSGMAATSFGIEVTRRNGEAVE